jgi:hypothetical protein
MMARARLLVERRPMNDDERRMAIALGRCSFVPGTFDKRFARKIAARAEIHEPKISLGEADLLRRLTRRYRRQIAEAVVALAGVPTPPVPSPDPATDVVTVLKARAVGKSTDQLTLLDGVTP